ncbi:MAG: hypothetical protein HYY99_01975 [Candidatus Colwellbacteria bacterium]|nr:hypothetical protein [Candidatus Colwellbacteria bacterium]
MTEFFVKTALAAGLVPDCGGIDPITGQPQPQCTENDFIALIVKVINFAIHDIAFPLVVLFFLIGGFLLLTSGGSPNRIEQGKKAMTGAVIGLVIVLTSVVLINTLIATFTKCNRDAEDHYDFSKIGELECPSVTKVSE